MIIFSMNSCVNEGHADHSLHLRTSLKQISKNLRIFWTMIKQTSKQAKIPPKAKIKFLGKSLMLGTNL